MSFLILPRNGTTGALPCPRNVDLTGLTFFGLCVAFASLTAVIARSLLIGPPGLPYKAVIPFPHLDYLLCFFIHTHAVIRALAAVRVLCGRVLTLVSLIKIFSCIWGDGFFMDVGDIFFPHSGGHFFHYDPQLSHERVNAEHHSFRPPVPVQADLPLEEPLLLERGQDPSDRPLVHPAHLGQVSVRVHGPAERVIVHIVEQYGIFIIGDAELGALEPERPRHAHETLLRNQTLPVLPAHLSLRVSPVGIRSLQSYFPLP